MSTKLQEILIFLQSCYMQYEYRTGRGRPNLYSNASMTLFFMVMMLKKVYAFKTMTKFVAIHYELFGFPGAPSRKTIRRRFLALPPLLHWLMPQIAQQCQELDYQSFRCSWVFVDKSVFRALGGVWHKKHRDQGIVPHPSIDTDASWGKSRYHGWRFGYGLHLMCLQNRFPVSARVTTASTKDHAPMNKLVEHLKHLIGIVVGDAGYQCLKSIRDLYENTGILLQTPKIFTSYAKQSFVKMYNTMIQTAQAETLYRKRKPSIEPLFSLIKGIFNLEGEKQLPYRGIDKVSSFLLLCPLTVQIMIRDNFINQRNWASTHQLFIDFK